MSGAICQRVTELGCNTESGSRVHTLNVSNSIVFPIKYGRREESAGVGDPGFGTKAGRVWLSRNLGVKS